MGHRPKQVAGGRPDPLSVANAFAADAEVARAWGAVEPEEAASGWVLALDALEAAEADIGPAPVLVLEDAYEVPVEWRVGASLWQGTEIANRDADDINWPVQVGHRLELAVGFGVFAVRLAGGASVDGLFPMNGEWRARYEAERR